MQHCSIIHSSNEKTQSAVPCGIDRVHSHANPDYNTFLPPCARKVRINSEKIFQNLSVKKELRNQNKYDILIKLNKMIAGKLFLKKISCKVLDVVL